MSDVVGLCNICGKPGAMHTCHLCGQIVCRNCYDTGHGVCTRCKPTPAQNKKDPRDHGVYYK